MKYRNNELGLEFFSSKKGKCQSNKKNMTVI